MGEFSPTAAQLATASAAASADAKRTGLSFKEYQDLKTGVHRDLISRVDLERIATQRDERIRAQVLSVIQDLVANLKTPLSGRERERLSLEVLDEVFGLGPLEPLLQDPTINDILVNGPKQVYVERAGILEESNVMFKDNGHLMNIIDKIVSAIGRRVDESSPMVDARLADGSRVNVIIPPLAIDGAHLSIRRFGHIPITSDHGRRSDQEPDSNSTHAGVATRSSKITAQHRGLRRHRRWKDDAPECLVRLHFRERENRHDRGFRRTADETAPLCAAGNSSIEHRGTRRGHAAATGHQ